MSRRIKPRRFEELEDILTVGEAACLLRVSRSHVYALCARAERGEPGGLPHRRLGARVLIPKALIRELVGMEGGRK